jgi:hypothetical protein
MSEQHLPVIPCQGTGVYVELLHPACNITINNISNSMALHTGKIPKYPHFSNSSCSSSELTDVCLSVSDNCFISLVVSEI